jgi:hypothetical protein
MGSLIVGLASLGLILVRQLQARPLKSGFVLVLVLGVLGLAETGAFLFGKQQFIAFVKGHNHHLALAVPDLRNVIIAGLGSLILAVLMGTVRASSERLGRRDGQVWRQGTTVTVVLWLVSLALHLGYDALIGSGSGSGTGGGFGAATLLLYFTASVAAQRAALGIRARWLSPLDLPSH